MVFFTLLLPILFGFMGLGFDVSMLYVNKGKLQDVADATALAGAAHIGEEGDGIKHAVEAFAKANGLQVTENELVAVATDGWSSLSELGDNENVRVAYGVVTVNDRPRLRVRVDKRVLMPFISVLLPDLEKGMPVVAVAAAEGETGDEPVFRIIGRNGVYDHFFNLAGSSYTGDPDKWINGSIYAGNMLRASYKQNNRSQGRNMLSVDGYIFADMFNTGLPVINGVTGNNKNPSDDRVFRSEYVRKKDGDKWLSGFEALTKTDYKGQGWSGTAQELAEQKLSEYHAKLNAMIASGEYKRKAMNKEDNCRYICNQAVKKKLDAEGKEVVGLKFERVNDNGTEQTSWEKKNSKETNHQYSNIDVNQKEIKTLYVEIQGDSKEQNLEDSREGAVWLGAKPKTWKLEKVDLLIVELNTVPTTEQANDGLTADKLTGTFVICPGDNGCEFGEIYSQANLVIRAPSNQSDKSKRNSFIGPIFSDRFVAFSFDDKCGGGGRAHPSFGQNTVIAGDMVLFGYGYEIGPSVFINEKHMGTYFYDDITNYKTVDSTIACVDNKWWERGITTVDYLNSDKNKQYFDTSSFNFHDEAYAQKNGVQNEIELLNKLWEAIDGRDRIYNEYHNEEICLYGSLYGDYGRWPTEFDGSKEIRMCSFGEREGTESATTKLRLVE